MRNYLNGSAKVVSPALPGKYVPVDFTGADAAASRKIFIDETFVMSQVKVGFGPVISDKNFTVLVGTHGTRVYVEIRVKFLKKHSEASLFKQPAQRCCTDSLSQSGNYSACNENVLCHCLYLPLLPICLKK